ncbi:MAG: hypothetical protein NT140_01860 [Deltaproteobacteria bacterium]|nr:hypothetical protein [Deltaproteobacteria bacterium]
MMNAPVTNKPVMPGNKVIAKPNTAKPANNQQLISQLRQEIKTLNKTIKDIQKKPDLQIVSVMMPRQLLSKANALLLAYSHSMGELYGISDLICDAVELYVWGDEENQRLEKEQQEAEQAKAESEK